MVDPGENVSVTLKREFGEEALNSLEIEEEKRQKLQKRISEFFTNGYEVSVKFIGHCWSDFDLSIYHVDSFR